MDAMWHAMPRGTKDSKEILRFLLELDNCLLVSRILCILGVLRKIQIRIS